MKKIFLIFCFFIVNFYLKAQNTVTEKDFLGYTFEISNEINKKWQSFATIKFKKHRIAELTLYAAGRKNERVLLPGTAIWEITGEKITIIGMEEGFRTLISENNMLTMIPNPTNVMFNCSVTRMGKDFLIISPPINWNKMSDADFEKNIKNKSIRLQTYKFRKI